LVTPLTSAPIALLPAKFIVVVTLASAATIVAGSNEAIVQANINLKPIFPIFIYLYFI
jgi:hypothetical protein